MSKRLIDANKLIERINAAEEQFKADHMESIGADDGAPFVDGVLSGVFNIREMVFQAETIVPDGQTEEVKIINNMRRNNPFDMTIKEQIEKVKEDCCDEICKHLEKARSGHISNEELEAICEECPLRRL